MKNFITDNIQENIYPILYNSPIHCETYTDSYTIVKKIKM